jgi:soluble lytic murein transglycosylase-like protein
VVAFRDSQGQLFIRNQEKETKGARVAPWEEAMAQLAPIIQEASLLYGLPVPLIQAVIKAESNFHCWAVSPKGAMGLMQLMPETAASLGVKDPFNPRENIHGGCRYLRIMLDNCKGSLPLALAAYNAGYQRVVSCGFQIPPIKETQGFVTEVLGRYHAALNTGTDAGLKSGRLLPVTAIIPE